MPRVALAAGELSGDRLGAGLIDALRRRRPDLEFVGIAGPAMAAAGCEVWADSEELAVMGLAEVLRHLPRLRRVFLDFHDRLLAEPPALFIGIDAPDFNLRLSRRLRAAGIPTVQYVCPSVWAWRSGRVETIRAACDLVLCLLPFEQAFLERHGVTASFVGHPLADTLPADPDRGDARRSLGMEITGQVVALLPGSRSGEVTRLGTVFAQTAAWLTERLPRLKFVVPMATPALRRLFEAELQRRAPSADVLLLDGRAHEAMAAADVVLLASGTATLEAMLLDRPMVVAYRLSPVTWGVLRGLDMVKVKNVALPNLLAGETVVPELLQDRAVPAALGPAVHELLESPALREAQSVRLRALGDGIRRDASERAAEAVAALLPPP